MIEQRQQKIPAPLAPWFVDEMVIDEIAVPVEATSRYDRGLAVATALAGRWRLPLRLFHVGAADDGALGETLESMRAASSARHPSVVIDATAVAADDIVDGLVSLIGPHALVVMATERVGTMDQTSTAEAVIRRTGNGALLTGPHVDADHVIGPMVLALDGSPTTEHAIWPAVRFAESLGQPLHLVQVIDASTTAHVAELRRRGERVSESGYLRTVVEQLKIQGHEVHWEVVHGDEPVKALLEASERIGPGPIVVGTHGRSGLPRRMLGSTAMGLVAEHRFPVLVVATAGRDEPALTAC